MTNKNWFQTGVAILITLLIITLVMQVSIVFKPLSIILSTIFLPLLLGGLLYYLTEPVQRFLERRRTGRLMSILVIAFIIILVMSGLGAVIVPMIIEETQNLIQAAPQLQNGFDSIVGFLMSQMERLSFDIQGQVDIFLERTNEILRESISILFTVLTNTIGVLVTLILVPFFLFFMLKDHEKFIPAATKPFSGKFKQFITELLIDIDYTLKSFIQGQLLVSVILAVILYIGYIIIGLNYALLLVIFALFMNIIPFVGPWIAYAPALILALIQDPILAVWVSVVTLIAQQIDGNIITPNVIGQSLQLHPLTVITIVLAAGNIAGFVGMLIAIPFYAVVKVVIQNIYRYRNSIKTALFGESV